MVELEKGAGKSLSPKVQQKQELKKQKQLANKYTINKKEWVLNQQDESMSINSDLNDSSPKNKFADQQMHRQKLQINPKSTILKLEDQSKSLEITEESKLIYLKKKQLKLERKRDKQFKKILNIFKESKLRRQMMRRKRIKDDYMSPTQSPLNKLSRNKTNSILSPSKNVDLSLQLEPGPQSIQDIYVQQEPSEKSRDSKPSSIKMPESDIFLKEDDFHEALEFNQMDLPEEYLLAKLALTNDHAEMFKKIQVEKSKKYELRRNTEFNFAKPDTFNDSTASIHDMIESDKPSILDMDEGLDNILHDFQKKSEFLKMVKYNNRNQNKELSESKQLHHTFVNNTQKYMDVPMPILLKIKKGTLILPSVYSITEGVSVAIAESLCRLDGLNETKLYKTMFLRNGMTDFVFSNVLKGLRARPEFGYLTSVANDIGEQSALQICALLERLNENPEMPNIKRMPDVIELKLQSSKATPKAMDMIIQSFNHSPCLKRLSLSNMNLSDRQLKQLFDYIRDSSLQYLDISWNKLTSASLAQLFQVLENNLTLEWLDMSFIQMGPADAHQEVLDKHFEKFCKFIKENQKLIHLNLTSCSIPEKQMVELIQNLKRSQSLHCVHLCGNQLTIESVDLMSSKLKPTYINEMVTDQNRKLYKNALLNKIEKDISSQNSKKQYQKIYGSIKLKDALMEWLSVQEQYQHSQVEDENFIPLILSKQLGHPEIRNSKHWKINNECYMCDKWKYTLIFWDLKSQGDPYQIKNPFLEEMIEDLIYNSNDRFSNLMQTKTLGDNAKAFITGTFTDWQPRRMMQIEELLAHYQGKHDAFKSKENMREFSQIIKDQWKRVLKKVVPYKSDSTQWVNLPNDFMFTTANPPEMDFNQLFVFCDFIKPGKHQYIVTYENVIVEDEPVTVQSEQNDEPQGTFDIYKKNKKEKVKKEPKPVFEPHIEKTKLTSYHEFFSQAYMHNYNINTKINMFDSIDRKFDKNKSVFKDWKTDIEKLIKIGFEDEISYWNVPNFVKDENEQKKITKFMIDNAVFLKTYFIIHSSNSSLPVIKWLYYAPMVTDWDIFDKVFTQADVDRIFIAVKNLKQELRGKVSESDMNRFQFYESIVRIAMNKYKNQGITDTVYEGVVKLVKEVLKPKYNNYLWMGWREDYLWTLEVDDLYKTNLTAMNKLYKFFFKVKKTSTFFLEDAVDMFSNQIHLDLLPELITQAWGLSKMTINNDIKHRDQYYKVTFVEFLEFFARIAEIKFKDGTHKNESLLEKIKMLMDLMFPLVSMKRKEVKIEIEYVSVSEEELVEDKYFV